MDNTGRKIRKLRELRNFTQKYMAERLGITQSNYARIENNKINLTESRLKKIAEILGTDKESIHGFDESYMFGVHNNKEKKSFGMQLHNYQISAEIKQLYEDKIWLLEEKIKILEEK